MTAGLGDRVRAHVARSAAAPAIVFDCSFVNGLSAIRQLHRLGVPVIAVDSSHQALGLRSRMALPLVCPHPRSDPDGFVSALADICAGLGTRQAVAFPTHDAYLLALVRAARPELVLPFGPPQLIEDVQAKAFQYRAAERAGVAVPLTAYPRTLEEAGAAAERIPLPAVMKPSLGDGFKAIHHRPLIEANTAEELVDAYRAGADHAPMLQEHIPGGDDCLWTVGSYLARDGRPLGVFCGRKLVQMPAGVGTCRIGEARWDEDAVDAALRLLRELGFHGISQVEFKRDPRDGVFKLMEVNARLWQWHSLASTCGVDLVALAYRDALGLPVVPVAQNHGHRRWISIAGHLRESRAEGRPLGQTLGMLRPPFDEPVLSLRDPMPGVHQWYALARSLRR
jgi:predicted ATP-grasp superfamily ATP-dependent carboligase